MAAAPALNMSTSRRAGSWWRGTHPHSLRQRENDSKDLRGTEGYETTGRYCWMGQVWEQLVSAAFSHTTFFKIHEGTWRADDASWRYRTLRSCVLRLCLCCKSPLLALTCKMRTDLNASLMLRTSAPSTPSRFTYLDSTYSASSILLLFFSSSVARPPIHTLAAMMGPVERPQVR